MTGDSPATPKRLSPNLIAIALGLFGVSMLVLYRIGLRAQGTTDIVWFLKLVGIQALIYLAVAWLSLRGRESHSVLIIGLIFATLFRLSILFSPPYLSDDIYRYVWDGRVQAAGVNPYRYIPADQSLVGLRDEKIYPNINRRDYARTIYPPVAEGFYFLTTRVSESVTWMKATMVGFEAIAIWAIVQLLGSFGLARQRVLIYAWHPLAVWEFAGSGHVDAVAIAFIALALLARRKNAEIATGVTLACATMVKFFPLVLFPAFYKRWRWNMPIALALTVLVAYLPYITVGPLGVLGFLPGYAGERGMISGEQFFILDAGRRLFNAQLPTVAYLISVLLLLSVLSVWMMRNRDNSEVGYLNSALIIAAVFMVLLAPHFAWYFSWLIPFLCFIPSLPVFYLTLASFLLYLTWLRYSSEQLFELKAFLFVPFLILGVIVIWSRRRTRITTPLLSDG
jgi:alpha-1,6-mannosyltransferase